MIDIVERLRFDSARCELQFSKGVAGNIDEAADQIERLRAALKRIADDDYTREDELLVSKTPTMIWQAVARQALGL